MIRLFDDLEGFYLPYFLYIYIKEYIDFENFEENSTELKGTFIHEYCHYLQDVSTTYGYYNFIKGFQELIYRIYPDEYEFQENVLKYNRDFASLYTGDDSLKDSICYINKVIVKKDDICAELRPDMDCDCVTVRYNGCKEFDFGSYCIAESMAYLVEKRLYQVQERYNQFPYNVCEMICKVEYEEFAQNDIYIIALCEMALLEANSGKFFVNVLRKMKNCNYLPKHINELEYFISTHYDIGFRGSRDSINSLLDVIYPNEIIEFENLKKWIITRYELGCEFREKSKCFIALFLSDNEHKYIYWQQIMDEFGCPNVEDGNGNLSQGAYLAEKSIDIGYMLAPMAISKIVGESTQICPLIDICKNDIRFMCTKKCENSPLKKKEENDSCPIALFARLYGLEK